MMTWIGWALIVFAAGYFGYKVYLSFTSAGGTDFMVPIYDGAIYPPALAVFGLYWVLGSFGIDWAWWVYLLLWVGASLAAAGIIRLSEEVGDRPL